MKKLFLVSSLFALAAFGAEMKGVISDAKCGAAHATKLNEKCVSGCVKGGQAPVFVTEGKVLKIADASKVMDHLGHQVKISGKVEGDTVAIDKIEMDSQ